MSAVRKRIDEAAERPDPVDAYDVWRARRDLERYIFDHPAEDGQVAPELQRLRAFLERMEEADLSGKGPPRA